MGVKGLGMSRELLGVAAELVSHAFRVISGDEGLRYGLALRLLAIELGKVLKALCMNSFNSVSRCVNSISAASPEAGLAVSRVIEVERALTSYTPLSDSAVEGAVKAFLSAYPEVFRFLEGPASRPRA